MERIIIRHLSGSRVNQVEEFPVKHLKELIIGRDPTATIKFDPDKDDMISRQHAKITQDEQDETKFILTDFGSRNGTYVNKTPVEGSVTLTPGDVIQLGPKGPEFEFDLDPRPEGAPKATRFDTSSVPPPTREAEYAPFTTATSASEQPRSVGPRTLEFIIGKVKGDTRKSLINISAALLGLLILIGGTLWYLNSQKIEKTQQELAQIQTESEKKLAQIQTESVKKIEKTQQELTQIHEETKDTQAELEKRSAGKSPEDIVREYSPATVFIQASWKLINLKDGNHACHVHAYFYYVEEKKGKKSVKVKKELKEERIPFYVKLEDGSIEPLLMTKIAAACRDEDKIGNIIRGTGFVVRPQGFILTNRHVAASWQAPYIQTSIQQMGTSREEAPVPAPPRPAGAQQKQSSNEHPEGYVCPVNKSLETLRKFEGYFIDQKRLDGFLNDMLLNADCDEVTKEDLEKIKTWVPAKSRQFGVDFGGTHEYIEVVFPNTNTTLKAHLVNISEVADAALIKVDSADPLKTVDLYMDEKDPKSGIPVIVLGYPVISLDTSITRLSQDPTNPRPVFKEVRNPTVTNGIIAKVISGDHVPDPKSGSTHFYSSVGDLYQLTINSTGAGNSGGPVFDTDGKVIGIFSYRWEAGGVSATGAIPIKYGRELLEIKPLQ